jgi:hypothetical protein
MLEKTGLLATVAAAGLVWACGGGGDADTGDGDTAADAGGETAAPVVDPATAGAISRGRGARRGTDRHGRGARVQ